MNLAADFVAGAQQFVVTLRDFRTIAHLCEVTITPMYVHSHVFAHMRAHSYARSNARGHSHMRTLLRGLSRTCVTTWVLSHALWDWRSHICASHTCAFIFVFSCVECQIDGLIEALRFISEKHIKTRASVLSTRTFANQRVGTACWDQTSDACESPSWVLMV